MAPGPKKALGNLAVFAGSFILICVFVGIGVAVILALIPTFLAKQTFTPVGEEYCIYNLELVVSFNSSSLYLNFASPAVNTSYPLSQACYRNLQSYKSDSLLRSCLISNCSFSTNVTTANINVQEIMLCTAIVYYSTRCSDAPPNYALNSYLGQSSNTACRRTRMSNIDGALGSTLFYNNSTNSTNTTSTISNSSYVIYTNVPSLMVSGLTIPVTSVYGVPFSNYSQVGARYCGTVTGTNISTAISTQASG